MTAWEPTLTEQEIDDYITEQLKLKPRNGSPFLPYRIPMLNQIVLNAGDKDVPG